MARFQQKDTVLFVLRVMVGAIILYDHVHPVGAFYRKSNIDVCGSSFIALYFKVVTVEIFKSLMICLVHSSYK